MLRLVPVLVSALQLVRIRPSGAQLVITVAIPERVDKLLHNAIGLGHGERSLRLHLKKTEKKQWRDAKSDESVLGHGERSHHLWIRTQVERSALEDVVEESTREHLGNIFPGCQIPKKNPLIYRKNGV